MKLGSPKNLFQSSKRRWGGQFGNLCRHLGVRREGPGGWGAGAMERHLPSDTPGLRFWLHVSWHPGKALHSRTGPRDSPTPGSTTQIRPNMSGRGEIQIRQETQMFIQQQQTHPLFMKHPLCLSCWVRLEKKQQGKERVGWTERVALKYVQLPCKIDS